MSNSLRALLVLTIGWTAFTSMSSAPIAGLLLQIFLICWHYALRENPLRWKILWALIFLAYLVIEFGSNQTPIQFYISKFTFDQQTGWYRIWIWEHGSASVLNNPWLGIGLNDWVRPKWMYSDSVDNFWLLTAMRHGLPALLFLAAACMATWRGIARRVGKDADVETAYLICMAMFVFVGSTVHFWGAVYVWFMFLLGAGVCMIEPKQVKTVEEGSSEEHQNVRRSAAGSVRPARTLIK